MTSENSNIVEQVQEEIMKRLNSPIVIEREAWNLGWRYTTRFSELIKNGNLECFVYFCRDFKNNSDSHISDAFFPEQTVSGYNVTAATNIDYDILSKHGIPTALCHYHHNMGAGPSGQDWISLRQFLWDYAELNSTVIVKEEDLSSVESIIEDKGDIIFRSPQGSKYVRITLHKNEVGKTETIENLIARMRQGRPFAVVQYGYSIILANASRRWSGESRREYSASSMVRCVYNDSQTPMRLSEDFLSKLRMHGARIEEDGNISKDSTHNVQFVESKKIQPLSNERIDDIIRKNVLNFKEFRRLW